jgi:predicted phage terminase large subunit-like protein
MAEKLSQKAFLDGLRDLADGFRRDIEAQVDGFDPGAEAQAARKTRAKADFGYFCREYFPHYIKAEPSRLHEWLFERLPRLARERLGVKLALAAPRGEAKSTICTQLFVIWCVVCELYWMIPIVMDTFEQAAEMLEAIKAELESNPRLLMDYPEATGQGRVWQAGVILTANNRKIRAAGSGKKLRGMRHGPHRPDLVVLDDIENDENVKSPDQRDKLQSWLTKAVLKLGAADDTMDVIYVGTVLHYDSLLARTLKNALWERRTFKAVVEWPNRMDLWDQWEELLLNEGDTVADAFYLARKAEMDAGAIVSWPAARPLVRLMRIRARDGHSAFDSELQNDPLSDESAPFAKVIFWVGENPRWLFYGAVDPSLGKQGNRRDPSAILVGGFDRQFGILDVVDATIAKRLPDKIISDVIEAQRKWLCLMWAVESVQFQEFFRTELVKRSAQLGVPVPARPVIPHSDKDLRIESLQPHVANGLIRFSPRHTTLLDQLRHWPKADHDDGPDALQMLWATAVSSSAAYDYKAVGHRGDSRQGLRGKGAF